MTIDLTDEELEALRLSARETLTYYRDKEFKGKYDKDIEPLLTALPKLETDQLSV